MLSPVFKTPMLNFVYDISDIDTEGSSSRVNRIDLVPAPVDVVTKPTCCGQIGHRVWLPTELPKKPLREGLEESWGRSAAFRRIATGTFSSRKSPELSVSSIAFAPIFLGAILSER